MRLYQGGLESGGDEVDLVKSLVDGGVCDNKKDAGKVVQLAVADKSSNEMVSYIQVQSVRSYLDGSKNNSAKAVRVSNLSSQCIVSPYLW
jgi:hypothetical protein